MFFSVFESTGRCFSSITGGKELVTTVSYDHCPMSIDKYVTHGLHGTLGSNAGQSLRSNDASSQQSGAGTSFVLGGGRNTARNYPPQSGGAGGSREALDSIRSYEAERIRDSFGRSPLDRLSSRERRAYREALEGSERYYHRFIAFAFLATLLIVVVFFIYEWPQTAQERVREMREKSSHSRIGKIQYRSYANRYDDE